MRSLVAMLALGSVVAASAEPAHAAACRAPERAEVVAQSRHAVVFSRLARGDELNSRREIWGCLRSSGRLTRVRGELRSETSQAVTSRLLRLRGRFVATVSQDSYRGNGSTSINVVDLRSGRASLIFVGFVNPSPGIPALSVSHLVLSSRGQVAWRQTGTPRTGSPPADLIQFSDRRRTRTLDAGRPGELTGLRIDDGRAIRWQHAGAPRRFALPR